jgi:pimeloyl-ACP methyl ester carboxylesterase
MATNATNIVLVHGFWADGSSWSKVIPILKNAGHQVIAIQLPLHSLADDVATTKRAVEQLGGPTILVGHSYGGFVITNAAHNNPSVTGLVYVAALAPDEGETLNEYVKTWPKNSVKTLDIIKPDSGGFFFISQDKFRESFAQDVDGTEADVMAVVQKLLINQFSLKNLALQPGSNFRHGFRYLRTTGLSILAPNVISQNE